MSKESKILDIDGQFRENPDFPVAVVTTQETEDDIQIGQSLKVVDPIFNDKVVNNLYGRIMTLVEATCDTHKLSAVKDLFSKELGNWQQEVYRSARELADGGNSSHNMYTRGELIVTE